MKKINYQVLIVCLLLVVNIHNAHAQEADPTVSNTVVFIQNSTLLIDQAAVFSAFDQYERPVWNTLVEEGKIMGYGHLTHTWGDEFNHNAYFVAESKSAFFEAWDTFFNELEISTEELAEIQSKIKKHKDNIYVHTAFYGNGENVAGAVMLNQNRVNFSDQSEWVSIFREYAFPILKNFVDQGKLNRFGLLLHEWGDDWNVNYYFHTDDQAQFNATWAEYIAELRQKHPEQLTRLIELTQDHKDNLYFERIPQK